MSLNRHLFTATGSDSGALNVLGTVVHQFEDTGEYRVDVFQDNQYLTHRYLVVDDEEPRTQVTVDASTLPEVQGRDPHERSCCCEDHEVLRLRENGHFVLDVSRGPGGFAVEVTEAEQDEPSFDSRELGEDETDYFAVTLMRPGEYAARRADGDAELTVTVPYPTGSARGVPEPERVALTDDGFDADSVTVRTGQGLVFEVDTAARVQVELEAPDDGDGDGGGGGTSKGRWQRKPGQVAGEQFDPAEFEAGAVERQLRAIGSERELRVVKQREARTRNRTAVIDAVDRRLQELAEASEE